MPKTTEELERERDFWKKRTEIESETVANLVEANATAAQMVDKLERENQELRTENAQLGKYALDLREALRGFLKLAEDRIWPSYDRRTDAERLMARRLARR